MIVNDTIVYNTLMKYNSIGGPPLFLCLTRSYIVSTKEQQATYSRITFFEPPLFLPTEGFGALHPFNFQFVFGINACHLYFLLTHLDEKKLVNQLTLVAFSPKNCQKLFPTRINSVQEFFKDT